MADRVLERDTSTIETKNIGQEVESLQKLAEDQRKNFARHWYDNNFFDDGHHFRFISRTTGRIVDLSDQDTLYAPRRAIPKASRQIRGMANLILSSDFIPLVKPEKVTPYTFTEPAAFQAAFEANKLIAKRLGWWLEEEWKDQDLMEKVALMLLLTMKHSVSFLQIWPDPVEEAIKTQAYDAFDIYLLSNLTEIEDSPFIGKVVPKTIKEIRANEAFDEDQLKKMSPDNRYASDEIKEAYLASKFGTGGRGSDASATLLQKEFFIKEYLDDDNHERIRKQENGGEILKNRKKGDPIIRHVFTAGKVWLLDEYINLSSYPFVDLRLEPGPIYQTPQMERFIPANKSLDMVMSRLEKFIHTMEVGVWLKRRGESFEITNVAGGLVAEYAGAPPQQMNLASIPAHFFRFIDLLISFIEEQGVTTSALGRIPSGVKAWGAIESLKASEFSNLYIPIKMLKKTIQRICEKMLDIADEHFITPQTVYHLEKGKPSYFDVIGQSGMNVHKKIKMDKGLTEVVPIKKDYKVDIIIESGLGYTEEGKKGRAMELATFMIEMAKIGLLTPDAVKLVVQRLLETYKFGPTAEIMEALDQIPEPKQPTTFSPDQQEQIKVAFLETIRDLKQAETGGAAPQAGGVAPQM